MMKLDFESAEEDGLDGNAAVTYSNVLSSTSGILQPYPTVEAVQVNS